MNPSPIVGRASWDQLCPVCHSGSKGCSWTDDGLHFCRGEATPEWACLGQDHNGFHHYRLRSQPQPSFSRANTMNQQSARKINWLQQAQQFHQLWLRYADHQLQLANVLRLPPEALDALPLIGISGLYTDGAEFTFPECDHTGAIIGISTRLERPAKRYKKCIPGSQRGLSCPSGWQDRSGPVFIVEGVSDTLAMTHAGLATIGRPNNTSSRFLPERLRDWPSDREMYVVGENDCKDDGSWPGRTGAETVAVRLAEKLQRPVRVVFPPTQHKDARAWLTDDESWTEQEWLERGRIVAWYWNEHFEEFEPSVRTKSTTSHQAAASAASTKRSANPNPPPSQPTRPNTGNPHDAPDDPHALAQAFLSPPALHLRFWREDFYRWEHGAYELLPKTDLKAQLTTFIRRHFVEMHHLELAAWKQRAEQNPDHAGRPPTTRKVSVKLLGDVVNALQGLARLDHALQPPAWLTSHPQGWKPSDVLALNNGLLHLPSRQFLAPNPDFFTLNASPIDYDPNAKPCAWLNFLASLWPEDPDTIRALQLWMGYLLTPDTRQQKILFLLGPKRSGKGTILRIIKELVGPGNVATPRLSQLEKTFGLSSLLGKTVALVSDLRLSGRVDQAAIVENLLAISGEDTVDVDRKHRSIVSTRLTTRFVIASNELPKLSDASGALASRFILISTITSFSGRDDLTLEAKLLAESPAILNWTLDGWQQLQTLGRLQQPKSGFEELEELEDLASPVRRFLQECCILELEAKIPVAELYQAWRQWCEQQGRRDPGTEQNFGRELRAACPKLEMKRPKQQGERWREYQGIRLRIDLS